MKRVKLLLFWLLVILLSILSIWQVVSVGEDEVTSNTKIFCLEDVKAVKYVGGKRFFGSIGEKMQAKLNAFASMPPADYIISPCDKYVLFFYGRDNGFGVVDLIASLGDDYQFQRFLRTLVLRSDFTIILDDEFVSSDYNISNKVGDPVLGWEPKSSAINTRGWIRGQSLSRYVLSKSENTLIIKYGSWVLYSCKNFHY